jgi:hypothetical protein
MTGKACGVQAARAALLVFLTCGSARASWIQLHNGEAGTSSGGSAVPQGRYGHGASLLADSLLISHGYRHGSYETALGGALQPQFLRDTASLNLVAADKAGVAWRNATAPSSAVADAVGPSARLGHAFVALGDGSHLLHGGDDGGASKPRPKKSKGKRSYTWSALSDVWMLRSKPSANVNGVEYVWKQITASSAPSLALHACVALPAQSRSASGSAGRTTSHVLCFGGLTAARKKEALVSSDNATESGEAAAETQAADSGHLWLVTVTTSAAQGTVQASWEKVDTKGKNSPHPRHGHAMSLFSRPVLVLEDAQPSAGGKSAESRAQLRAAIEYSVFVFGGNALRCSDKADDIDSPLATQIREQKEAGDAIDMSASSSSSSSSTCTFADLWRFTWLESDSSGDNGAKQHPAMNGQWEHVLMDEKQEVTKASSSDRHPLFARLDGELRVWRSSASGDSALSASRPPPLVHPAMATVAGGLLLHGGALCNPGCICSADTWLLRLAPVAWLDRRGGRAATATKARGSKGKWRERSLLAIGAAQWEQPQPTDSLFLSEQDRERMQALVAAAMSDASASRWAPFLSRSLKPAVAPGLRRWWNAQSWQEHAPPARFRHTLNSLQSSQTNLAYDRLAYVQQLLQRYVASALDADEAASLLLHHYGLPPTDTVSDQQTASSAALLSASIAVAYGGESYHPSRYFGDAWLWWDTRLLQQMASPASRGDETNESQGAAVLDYAAQLPWLQVVNLSLIMLVVCACCLLRGSFGAVVRTCGRCFRGARDRCRRVRKAALP